MGGSGDNVCAFAHHEAKAMRRPAISSASQQHQTAIGQHKRWYQPQVNMMAQQRSRSSQPNPVTGGSLHLERQTCSSQPASRKQARPNKAPHSKPAIQMCHRANLVCKLAQALTCRFMSPTCVGTSEFGTTTCIHITASLRGLRKRSDPLHFCAKDVFCGRGLPNELPHP